MWDLPWKGWRGLISFWPIPRSWPFFLCTSGPFSSLHSFLDFSSCTGLETVEWPPGNHCSSGKNICCMYLLIDGFFFFWKSRHLPCKLLVIPSLRFLRIHPVSQYTFSLVTGCCPQPPGLCGRGLMLCDVCQSDVKLADDSFFSFFRTECHPWMTYWQTTPPPPLLYIVICFNHWILACLNPGFLLCYLATSFLVRCLW